jgi:hypothetical protein
MDMQASHTKVTHYNTRKYLTAQPFCWRGQSPLPKPLPPFIHTTIPERALKCVD